MKTRTKIFWGGLALLLALGLVGIGNVLAAVSTDQNDYVPGSVVTVSGDNSDGAGYLAGETVHVDVSGPNGYLAACDAIPDDAGSWSCQVTLAGDNSAIGDYTYTAMGQTSGVSQSGVFSDTNPPEPPADLNIYLNNDTAQKGEDCPDDGLAYWHFVASPNDGTVHFITFYLNLGDSTLYETSTFIKNHDQVDNVFVAVPSGYTLESLDKSGSYAYVHWDGGKGNQPDKFQLSHICPAKAQDLTVSKTANPSYTRTFDWTIDKSADKLTVYSAGGGESEPVNFIVAVTKDAGTDSDWAISGTITVHNPNNFAVAGVSLSDATPGGDCTVDPVTVDVAAGYDATAGYMCTFTSNPGSGTNTATATWPDIGSPNTSGIGTADYSFGDPTTLVNNIIHVTDTNGYEWDFSDSGSQTYQMIYTDPAGTCTSHENIAVIDELNKFASAMVEDCQGADLTVEKTAVPTFTRTYNWDISKAVDETLVKQIGGTATFDYTVTVTGTDYTDSDWAVSGTIHVVNPNDWEAMSFDASDAVPGGDCMANGGTNVTVAASGYVDLPYSCTFAAQPDYNTDIVNTATATWNSAAYHTPNGSAFGDATFQFTTPTNEVNKTVTVKDNFNSVETTLGTVDYPEPGVFTYSHTVNVPEWNCVTYDNTAMIFETGQSASQTVKVCGPIHTGALTMGFWQNKNGQNIIKSYCEGMGGPSLHMFLAGYNPFADDSATTCTGEAAYVTSIIKAANASGTSMNAMLKAQMLATALDVYFSDPALGGNKINAPAPIGAVTIDLTKVCKNIGGGCTNFEDVSSAFGGTTSMSISNMLVYAAGQSDVGGNLWYGNNKATQELAKDAFDAINNQRVFAP